MKSAWASSLLEPIQTEKTFRNLIKLNPNQIVFIISRLIYISKRTVSVCRSKSFGKMVISIWFQFDLVRFEKYISLYVYNNCIHSEKYIFQILLNQTEIRLYSADMHLLQLHGRQMRQPIRQPCQSSRAAIKPTLQ